MRSARPPPHHVQRLRAAERVRRRRQHHPAQLAFFNVNAIQQQNVSQKVYAVSFNGDLGPVKSPWALAPASMAIGAENRETYGGNASDGPSQIQGEVLGTGAPLPDRQGTLKLKEAFLELQMPIVSGKPYIESLAFEGGYRTTDFDLGVSSQTYDSWKYGGDWRPSRACASVPCSSAPPVRRTSTSCSSRSFRGCPNLAVDPCQGSNIKPADVGVAGTLTNLCVQTGVPVGQVGSLAAPSAGQINVVAGGNLNLSPEEADTTTLGFVFEPAAVPGLSMSVDYYKITIEKAVSSATASQVMDGCYNKNRLWPELAVRPGARSPVDAP